MANRISDVLGLVIGPGGDGVCPRLRPKGYCAVFIDERFEHPVAKDTLGDFFRNRKGFKPMKSFYYLFFTLILTTPFQAHAQCTMPNGQPNAEMGVIIFNKAHKVMQYCNGDDWIGLWGGGSSNSGGNSDDNGNGNTGGGGAVERIKGEIVAFALTACPTGWREYTAARGRFLRGIDSTGTNDTVRTIGNVQADALASHTHTGTAASAGAHTHTGTAASAGEHTHNIERRGGNGSTLAMDMASWAAATSWGSASAVLRIASAGAHTHTLTINSAGAHTHTLTINATGAAETRPKNVAVLYCIKD